MKTSDLRPIYFREGVTKTFGDKVDKMFQLLDMNT